MNNQKELDRVENIRNNVGARLAGDTILRYKKDTPHSVYTSTIPISTFTSCSRTG